MDSTNADLGFKLLAIRPLKGCDEKYSKNLELGRIYTFYNDYQITLEVDLDGTRLVSISHTQTVPNRLYDVTTVSGNPININISAIVGKNGSGKSTLLELFYGMIYLLAEEEDLLVDDGIRQLEKEIKALESITVEKADESTDEDKVTRIADILRKDKNENSEDQLKNIFNVLIPDPVHIDSSAEIAHKKRRLQFLQTFFERIESRNLL